MKILVTGAQGFVGKNLIAELKKLGYIHIYEYDLNTDKALLDTCTRDCDFVFHLAGVNRPREESEFDTGNREFTAELLEYLQQHNNTCPIVYSSSIQAERDNPYGISKKAAEDVLIVHAQTAGAKVMIYRLLNLFGKWCRPNYNSVVATFCHNIARGLDIIINDPNAEMTLCYIDDVVNEFINALEGNETRDGQFCYVAQTHKARLGELADKLYDFKSCLESNLKPLLETEFDRALYSTYISYLPEKDT
ncbi:MAG: NAD-dependent epimerase/dehydratase family protein [Candidatus Methanofastidiosum sp.]|nr:NAD-dependent epimerase/dehydratase family protein [Methanofastidiosum sp.]